MSRRFWQHWTRLASRRNAVGIVYCEQHHEQMLALRTITQRRGQTVIQFIGGHAVRLSPSAARDRYCATCLRRPFEVEAGASVGARLGFQPINSRTHGYNGQEHR